MGEHLSDKRGYWSYLVIVPVKKKKKTLLPTCRHHQDGQLASTELSDLCCNRLHITAIKQARRQEQRPNSLLYPGRIILDWKNQRLFTKTASVYAIRGILHHSTLDSPRRTEGQLKMLGSGIVPTMTPKSSLSRHKASVQALVECISQQSP